jgi:hypothetical protein
MGKKERHARTAKAEKTSFSKLNNKIRKKGKNKGMLPQSMKSQKKRVEQYGFDLTQASRPQLEKLPVRARLHPSLLRRFSSPAATQPQPAIVVLTSRWFSGLRSILQEDDLRAMSMVRGQGRQGNKQQLINGLLGFKMKIQTRDVREHLYAQYLAVRSRNPCPLPLPPLLPLPAAAVFVARP